MTFKELQDEVLRRAIRNQGGDQFDDAVKNIINTSLFRVAREARWRPLRQQTTFKTVPTTTAGSGSGSFTNGSANIIATSGNWITQGIKIGRRIKLSGDSTVHTIRAVNSNTSVTIEEGYGGTSALNGTLSILGQEEYNLPVHVDQRSWLWHEEYGYPYMMNYVPSQKFYYEAWDNTSEGIPTDYRMWGENFVLNQPTTATAITIESSSATDTGGIDISVFGNVAGYPDKETIRLNSVNSTTKVSGTAVFTTIDRIAKSDATAGRITVYGQTGTNIITVIPTGDITSGIKYSKIQIYPLPDTEFDVNVMYYKEPYKLVDDNDVHELGQEFDEAIILLSVSKLKYENSQVEGDRWMNMYIDEIRNLRKVNVDKIDWKPELERPFEGRTDPVRGGIIPSQAGPYYGYRVR